MNPLRGKAKILAIASIVLIITISYGLFFYLQNTNETNTRNSIFEQQKAHQMQSTQALSQRISSDLSFMMATLQGLADSSYLQQADLSSDKTKKLLQEVYFQINNITVADRLFIINKNHVVVTAVIRVKDNGEGIDPTTDITTLRMHLMSKIKLLEYRLNRAQKNSCGIFPSYSYIHKFT